MVEYQKYKSTNYQWVGDIPDHWDCNRIGRTTYVKGRIGWKGLRSEDFLDEGPYLLTGTDFVNGSINWSTCYRVDEERYAEDPFIIIKNDDVLITKDGSIGKIAHVREIKGPSTLNSGIFVTRPLNKKYLQRYFYWIVSSSLFSQFIEYNSSGSTILHLYQNVFERFFFPLPTIPEQKLITQYLDKKIQKIDSLMQKIEKKIKLLKEENNALINQYVTKGTDPNVEMKDSGIDWVGDIPKHWEIKKIGYLNEDLISGPFGSSLTKDLYVKDGFKIYGQEQVIKDDFDYGDYFITEEKYNEMIKYKVRPNDILISCVGTFGKIAKVPFGCKSGIINPRLIKLTLKEDIHPDYFLIVLRSHFSYQQLESLSRGGTMGVINLSILKELVFLLPQIDEQVNITNIINKHNFSIEKICKKLNKEKVLLEEYRQSLISSVVTGKIRVTEDMI